MSMGGVYVEVSADMVNPGISLLSSGTTGEEGGSYWINWNSTGGFINQGWEYEDSYLSTGWPLVADKHNQTADYSGFLAYMATEPTNLDDVLGGWDHTSKWAFLQGHIDIFISCTTPGNV